MKRWLDLPSPATGHHCTPDLLPAGGTRAHLAHKPAARPRLCWTAPRGVNEVHAEHAACVTLSIYNMQLPMSCSSADHDIYNHHLDDAQGLAQALVVQWRTAILLRHALQHAHILCGGEALCNTQAAQQRRKGRQLQRNHIQPWVQAERATAGCSRLCCQSLRETESSIASISARQTACLKRLYLNATEHVTASSAAPEGHVANGSEACSCPNDWSVRKQLHSVLQLCCRSPAECLYDDRQQKF